MTAPVLISGLASLAGAYDALLCDIWGVIHNGREHFPEACDALAAFREHNGPVVLISNSPRPREGVIEQLDALGVPRACWSAIVTSGDVTRELLRARSPGPAWAIGPDRDAPLYEGLGLQFAGPGEASFISCTGPVDDEVEGPEDYRKDFELARARDLEMICANPDLVVQRGDRLIYCGGALAKLYEEMGGSVSMAGKPFAPIYASALAEVRRLSPPDLEAPLVLCIGDGAPTDIRGANAQGLDVLFVANGIHGADAAADGPLNPRALRDLLAQDGAMATYAIAELTW